MHYSTVQARKIRETFQAGEVLYVADAAWNRGEERVGMGEMSSESQEPGRAAIQSPLLLGSALTWGPPTTPDKPLDQGALHSSISHSPLQVPLLPSCQI